MESPVSKHRFRSRMQSSIIPNNISFMWLDTSVTDYTKFKNQFCQDTSCDHNLWSLLKDKSELTSFAQNLSPPEKFILIATGRLGESVIPAIHDLEQLHSAYIFCNDVTRHKQWSDSYKKVRGVYNNAEIMRAAVKTHLVEPQNTVELSPAEAAAKAAIPPVVSRPEPTADEYGVDYFAQPGVHWCPWNASSCSKTLVVRGQGTVEIMEQESMPFELCLSNKQDPHDQNAYKIVLMVNKNEAKLSANNVVLDRSNDPYHTLQQSDDGKWQTYWLSLFKDTRHIRYGIGETRLSFTIFDVILPENDLPAIKEVYYLHVKLDNNEQMLRDLGNARNKFRFFIGKESIVYDPPLVVVPQSEFTLDHATSHTAIAPSELEKPCRHLYDSAINFSLNDASFPDFVQAIENSLKNPNGWCHRKLKEKANRFGRPHPKATYLRITVGKLAGNAPGHSYVVEIWPPGHYSPVHNHSNAYGIIRVLYGRILIKLFPTLTLNIRNAAPIEQILEEGQVTWMLPKLNQTHQVKNLNLYGTCCITLQCYQYGQEDRQHYEYFDYIANDGLSIGHFDPKSDMDFADFKRTMQKEWHGTP